jgi:glycosyltransferase involved in cell wall biosynthesis
MSSNSRSPRILYVSEIVPRKAGFGAEMRCLNIARALRELGPVDTVILNDRSKHGDLIATDDSEFPIAYGLDVTQRPNESLADKIRWTFDRHSNYPLGCGVGPDAMRRIQASAESYDLIWFFTLRAPEMFPNASWQRSVVDIDDLPTTYQRAVLQKGGRALERLSAMRRLFAWRRRERLLGERFTVLTVCSEEDREYLERNGVKAPIHVIQNGFDMPRSEPVHHPMKPPRIGFIGLFDHFPNRDAIHWFVSQCWPLIKHQIPNVRLRVAGEDTGGFLKSYNLPDIDLLGWLPDPSDEIGTWSTMVVPIRLGAGTRIKIAQGFSQKCPVVSTTFGAYGYGALDGREMYLADSAEDFANACIKVISQPESAAQMAERAWRKFLDKWTWDAIRPLVWRAAEDCLRRSSTHVEAG